MCLNFFFSIFIVAGDEIVSGDDMYGGSDRLLSRVVPKSGVVVKLILPFLRINLNFQPFGYNPKIRMVQACRYNEFGRGRFCN